MATATRNIFRSKALEQRAHGWEKTILPRFVAPRVFLFLWVMLGLLFIATIVAWLARVPMYTTGTGVVLAQGEATGLKGDEAVAAIFLPATSSLKVQAGSVVLVQIGSSVPQLKATVLQVQPGVMSPHDIRQRYALDMPTVTEPSVVVFVGLGPAISAQSYAGSHVSAQVQIGTHRVLSLLPGFNQLIGE